MVATDGEENGEAGGQPEGDHRLEVRHPTVVDEERSRRECDTADDSGDRPKVPCGRYRGERHGPDAEHDGERACLEDADPEQLEHAGQHDLEGELDEVHLEIVRRPRGEKCLVASAHDGPRLVRVRRSAESHAHGGVRGYLARKQYERDHRAGNRHEEAVAQTQHVADTTRPRRSLGAKFRPLIA